MVAAVSRAQATRVTDLCIRLSILVAAIVNIVPVVGLLSRKHVARGYDVRLEDPNLVVLMRHRALLFGLLGSFLAYAAFVPALHGLAFAGGLVSMLGFGALGLAERDRLSRRMWKLLGADLIATAVLLLGLALHWAR